MIEFFFGRSGQKATEVEDRDSMEEVVKESGSIIRRTKRTDFSPLMDVPLQITVEVGWACMTIENLLKLNQGLVGEPEPDEREGP